MVGSGVKKKYRLLPSSVMNAESSAPAVFIASVKGTGLFQSVECKMGGCKSISTVTLTASTEMELSRVFAGKVSAGLKHEPAKMAKARITIAIRGINSLIDRLISFTNFCI